MFDKALLEWTESSEDEVFSDWETLTIESLDSILDRLMNFVNDTQRVSFLNYVIKNIFDNGKGHNYVFVKEKKEDRFPNPKAMDYVDNCFKTVGYVLTELSEHCLAYKDVDFPMIVKSNFRVPEIDPFEFGMFVVYCKNDSNEYGGEQYRDETKDNSSVNKIAFLHELGIIDFLTKKLGEENIAANGTILGKLISEFTGINPSTATRSCNSIISGETYSKNYPLTPKRIEKIRHRIEKIKSV